MAGSLNKVMLIGNLGADPEIKSLNSGSRIANLRVATSESWKDKATGERKEKTEWHRVVVFNDNLVKVVESFCQKGTKLYLEGQIQTRKWQGPDGKDCYSTEVVLQNFGGTLTILAGGREREQSGGYQGGGGGQAQGGYGRQSAPQGQTRPGADLDEEIPF